MQTVACPLQECYLFKMKQRAKKIYRYIRFTGLVTMLSGILFAPARVVFRIFKQVLYANQPTQMCNYAQYQANQFASSVSQLASSSIESSGGKIHMDTAGRLVKRRTLTALRTKVMYEIANHLANCLQLMPPQKKNCQIQGIHNA